MVKITLCVDLINTTSKLQRQGYASSSRRTFSAHVGGQEGLSREKCRHCLVLTFTENVENGLFYVTLPWIYSEQLFVLYASFLILVLEWGICSK